MALPRNFSRGVSRLDAQVLSKHEVRRPGTRIANERLTALPLALTLVFISTGMAYSLWWPDIVRHTPYYWADPSDIWSSVRAAHFVQWGGLSYVYSYHSSLLTLPGFDILLAPVAAICSALKLSESSPIIPLYKPQAWLVIGPYCLAFSGLVLFGADALARSLSISRGRRRVLVIACVAAVWPAVAMWGHPEDAVALGLAAYALLALSRDRMVLAGWLLGGAIAMQLFVVLIVPVFIGIAGLRKATAMLMRAAVLPGFLLVAVLVPDFHDAVWTLTHQPGYPSILHPTPWMGLAPRINRLEVSSGPVHFFALAMSIGLGFLARRWRASWPTIVWLAAVSLAVRCVFEPVMVPYYVMPPVVLALVVGAARGRLRWSLTLAAGLGVTVMTFSHASEWTYWCEMTALLIAMFVLARPRFAIEIDQASTSRPWVVPLPNGEPDREVAEMSLLEDAPARALQATSVQCPSHSQRSPLGNRRRRTIGSFWCSPDNPRGEGCVAW